MLGLKIKLVFLAFCVLLNKRIEGCCKQVNDPLEQYNFPLKAIAMMKGEVTNPDTNTVQVITGSVTFEQPTAMDPLKITVNISGLLTGKTMKHGLHVHETGFKSTSNNVATLCGSSGGHYNPTNMTHGDITSKNRHVGDYGNILSNPDGVILQQFSDKISKIYGPYSILGRALVLHAQEDDLGLGSNEASKLNGNSGARIACGMIGAL